MISSKMADAEQRFAGIDQSVYAVLNTLGIPESDHNKALAAYSLNGLPDPINKDGATKSFGDFNAELQKNGAARDSFNAFAANLQGDKAKQGEIKAAFFPVESPQASTLAGKAETVSPTTLETATASSAATTTATTPAATTAKRDYAAEVVAQRFGGFLSQKLDIPDKSNGQSYSPEQYDAVKQLIAERGAKNANGDFVKIENLEKDFKEYVVNNPSLPKEIKDGVKSDKMSLATLVPTTKQRDEFNNLQESKQQGDVFTQAVNGVTEKVAKSLSKDDALVKLASFADVSIKPPATHEEYLKIANDLITKREFTAMGRDDKPVTVSIAAMDKGLSDIAEKNPDIHKKIIEQLGAESVEATIPDDKKRQTIAKSVADGVNENTGLWAMIMNFVVAFFDWMSNGKSGDGIAGLKESIATVAANKSAESVAANLTKANIGLDEKTIKEIAGDVRSNILAKSGIKTPETQVAAKPESVTTEHQPATTVVGKTTPPPAAEAEKPTVTTQTVSGIVVPQVKPKIPEDIIAKLKENPVSTKIVQHTTQTPAQTNTQPADKPKKSDGESHAQPAQPQQARTDDSGVKKVIAGIVTKLLEDVDMGKLKANGINTNKQELINAATEVITNSIKSNREIKELITHNDKNADKIVAEIITKDLLRPENGQENTNNHAGIVAKALRVGSGIPDTMLQLDLTKNIAIEIANNRKELSKSLAYSAAGAEKIALAPFSLGNKTASIANLPNNGRYAGEPARA